MKFDILKTANSMAKRIQFKGEKYAPELLLGLGIVTGVAACFKACTATPKALQVIEAAKDEGDLYEETLVKHPDEYTHEDLVTDKRNLAIRTAARVAKEYAPAIILGTVSIMAILASHGLLRKRNAALSAAYMTLSKSYEEYRERVKQKIGADEERKIRYNVHEEEETKTVKDPETGEEKTVTEKKQVYDFRCSPYARMFDEVNSIMWDRDPFHNKCLITGALTAAQARLRSNGYLFLNDVYDMLGLDRTEAGQIVGWIYDPKDPYGDSYVSFGLDPDHATPGMEAFLNGDEPNVILDFNVAGDIVSIMKKRKMMADI